MGMRLFASEYWKCAETACINQSTSNLKFVFAESLIDSNFPNKYPNTFFLSSTFFKDSRDQITTFITQHNNQAGIQHLGFTCIKNINDAVRVAKANGAQFLTPCANYYLKVTIKQIFLSPNLYL